MAVFKLSEDGTELHYRLVVSHIRNIVGSHIHMAPLDANGAVVAALAGPIAPGAGRFNGILATGTITEADLVGPLAGKPMSALVEAMEAGNTYVNVHTNDGIDPPNTGPGDIASGEVRGQIFDPGQL